MIKLISRLSDSIVSSICGIESNITIENFSKHLGLDIDEVIEFDYGDLGDLEGTSQLNENNGTLVFSWEGPEDHGITKLLKDIFNEEYLLRVNTYLTYGNDPYLEIMIYDNQKLIVENVCGYDHKELTPEEKENHDNRDEDSVYIKSEDVLFIKKSDFNLDSIKGKPIKW